MIFDFSDKINVKGLRIVFSNDKIENHIVGRNILNTASMKAAIAIKKIEAKATLAAILFVM